jgi:hypothetical protein
MSTRETLDALKLLRLLAAECESVNDHKWRKCKRCTTLRGLEMRFGLTMRLLNHAIEALASSAVQPEPPTATVDEEDAATRWLLQAMDDLYPMPDDDRRTERAGRTCYALKQWMSEKVEELEKMVPKLMDRFKVAPVQPEPARPWRSIETHDGGDVKALFWLVPLPADECPTDGSGRPITALHVAPFFYHGRYGNWGSLFAATHWQPEPTPPSSAGSAQERA